MRPPSPTTTDELGSDISTSPSPSPMHANAQRPGSPQTGVKSIIRDAAHSASRDRAAQLLRARETNALLERRALVGITLGEETALLRSEADLRLQQERKGDEKRDEEEEREKQREDAMMRSRRGAVREVGEDGLVSAVERPGWALLLIYEPEIPRCGALLNALLRVAINHPYTKPHTHQQQNTTDRYPSPLFLKARATVLSFSLLPSESKDEAGESEREADPDVLPTLLAYKDGDLQHTWVRVDWQVGSDGAGLERLLRSWVFELYLLSCLFFLKLIGLGLGRNGVLHPSRSRSDSEEEE